jgi:hypothetical protein
MRDITFNGAYPVARFSSVSALGFDETQAAFQRLVREHEILSMYNSRCLAKLYAPLRKWRSAKHPEYWPGQAKSQFTLIFTVLNGDIEIGMRRKFNVRHQVVAVPAGVPRPRHPEREPGIIEIDQDHLNPSCWRKPAPKPGLMN